MAKRRKKRRSQNNADFPGWIWMLFGLGIGLAVAAAVYFRDQPVPTTTVAAKDAPEEKPRVVASAVDDNGETAALPEEKESRFDFYELLKKMEVEVDAAEPTIERDTTPRAVVDEGTYILQAGSFSRSEDAERRRAEVALLGIESRVFPARVNGTMKYRVYIGPTSDLDELNLLRRKLREGKIDVLRITVDK